MLARMMKPARQDELRTDVFQEDFVRISRSLSQVIWVLLAIIVVSVLLRFSDPLSIYFLGGLLAFFGLATEIMLRRAERNIPVITIGSEGVSIPQKHIGPIPWDRVTRVRVKQFHTRGTTITALDFRFRQGTLPRWQFGRLGVDRWEVITGIRSIFGTTAQIQGGLDRLVESVERFHPVER